VTRFIRANGLQFACDEAGEGDGVALLLHGFPESRFSWRHQLPALAGAGWRTVAVDMRGYGESDKPPGRDAYRLEHLTHDVAALFEALGAKRRLLVGHDWGAMVAWTTAIRRVVPLDGLVVMNVPHPAVFRRVIARSWAQRRRSWYMAAFQVPVLPELAMSAGRGWLTGRAITGMAADPAAFPPAVLDVYRANAVRPHAMTSMINYYRANAVGPGPEPAWGEIETPTLMIWGEADKALGLELTEGYDGLVKDFTLQRLPGVSHWVQQEAPDAVNARLTEWLDARGLRLK
jgi:epoxide hydrolase 4